MELHARQRDSVSAKGSIYQVCAPHTEGPDHTHFLTPKFGDSYSISHFIDLTTSSIMATIAQPIALTPGVVVGATLQVTQTKEREWPLEVEKVPIPFWDTGVFVTELANLNKLPMKFEHLTDEEKAAAHQNPEALFQKAQDNAPEAISEGTYRGTQLALTKVYQLIEKSYESFMDTANFEPSIPSPLSLEQKRRIFSFTDPATDGYPPHLNLAANKSFAEDKAAPMQKSTLTQGDLFNVSKQALQQGSKANLVIENAPGTIDCTLATACSQDVPW